VPGERLCSMDVLWLQIGIAQFSSAQVREFNDANC
jgi:hypothetical protein